MPLFPIIHTQQEAKAIWVNFHAQTKDMVPGIDPVSVLFYQKKLSPQESQQFEKDISDKFKNIPNKIINEIRTAYPDMPETEIEKLRAITTKNHARYQQPRCQQPRCQQPHYHEHAARIIQQHWNKLREQDTLIPVNLNGNHDDQFNFVVNRQQITRGIHREKLNTLAQMLHPASSQLIVTNYNHPIFQDKYILELTLSLFTASDPAKKITLQQLYTVLRQHQALQSYELIERYAILDEKGQFTKAALTILLPSIQKRRFLKSLNPVQMNTFRLLIFALPLSEQFFYTTQLGKNGVSAISHLGEVLINSDIILTDSSKKNSRLKSSKKLIHLSEGATNALGIVRFGNNYVRTMFNFGEKPIQEIEEKFDTLAIRLGAICFPKTIPYKNIHLYKDVTPHEASGHDDDHGLISSCFPQPVRTGLRYLKALFRETLQLYWFKETWHLTDMNMSYLLSHHKELLLEKENLSVKELTTLFCKSLIEIFSKRLSYGSYLIRQHIPEDSEFYLTKSYYNVHEEGLLKWSLLPLGAVMLLDMVKNKNYWQEMRIDPDHFTEELKCFYDDIVKIYPTITENDIKIQIFKCLVYQYLKEDGRKKEYLDVFSRIDNEFLLENFAFQLFEKNFVKEKFLDGLLANSTYLSYKGKLVDAEFIQTTFKKPPFNYLAAISEQSSRLFHYVQQAKCLSNDAASLPALRWVMTATRK